MPPSKGFVVERGGSPHVMGGAYRGEVPVCPICEAPCERVLGLSAAALPFRLRHDASFFWYTCACAALDSTMVQLRPDGRFNRAEPA